MKGHGEKLTRKQQQAVATLLAEPTLAAAAARCGVGQTTLWRWFRVMPTYRFVQPRGPPSFDMERRSTTKRTQPGEPHIIIVTTTPE